MATTGVTFEAHVIQPRAGQADERPPLHDLPSELTGYTRTDRTLLVSAVRDSDSIIVGMGGGWIMSRAGRDEALFVKSAEVNAPHSDELRSELLEMLGQFANRIGIYKIYLPPDFAAPASRPSISTDAERTASRRLPAAPECPVCHRGVSFAQGLGIWNPWRVSCPHCRAPLNLSRFAKASWVASAPLGLLIAFVAIYREEAHRWTRFDSAIYFAVCVPLIVLVGDALWTRLTFAAKPPPAR